MLSDKASQTEQLAAKEIRKYIYLRTGKLLRIRLVSSFPVKNGPYILVGSKNTGITGSLLTGNLKDEIKNLENEEYLRPPLIWVCNPNQENDKERRSNNGSG